MASKSIMTAKAVEAQNIPGYHSDGTGIGLYLVVSEGLTKSWAFRYKINGKPRELGIGSLKHVTLADARAKVHEFRKMIRDQGIDPKEARDAAKQVAKAQAQEEIRQSITFAMAAKDYIDGRAAGWSNPKHVEQWRNTLTTYCTEFSSKPVGDVGIDDLEAALRPIWLTKTETATRVMTRVIAVLAYSHDKGWRESDDAESWGLRLRRRLPMLPKKRTRVKHHPALPFAQMQAFMAALKKSDAMGSRSLEFAILCASRSNEVRGAKWDEFDLDAGVWTIPGERMKAKQEHRVPLSKQALAILSILRLGDPDSTGYVFPGTKEGTALSDMTMTAFIRRQNEKQVQWADESGEPITQHGFRSTFRDWASEMTSYPNQVAEMALAHTVSDKVEAAYRRGDLFEKRRALMQDWADYCCPLNADVAKFATN